MGWNKKNVKGMLQHFAEGKIPGEDGPPKNKSQADPKTWREFLRGDYAEFLDDSGALVAAADP